MRDLLLERASAHNSAYRGQIDNQFRSPGKRTSHSNTRSRSSRTKSQQDNCFVDKPVHPDGFTAPLVSLTAEPLTWGRFNTGSWLAATGCTGIVVLCPLLTVLLYIALERYNGSLFGALGDLLLLGPSDFLVENGLRATTKAFFGYTAWLLFQATLYIFLPGPSSTGQMTPAGYLLKYNTNGLNAWVVTHVLAVGFVYAGLLDPAILAKNWEGLLVVANFFGFLLATISYVKAHLMPTHAEDRKFSGSILYDFYMGVELNPRLGQAFDFKLFTNGRPGIVAWTLVDLSFTMWQYQLHGKVTNSMIIVDTLHALYVLDFFINEDWYLRTIDICHDHFGFYLAWGSVVWLPSVYTLQTQYLARYPVELSHLAAAIVLVMGISGYAIFRSVNDQKNRVRKANGDCIIWGKQAEYIRCSYTTSDGKIHESLLLCSGWWGTVRHANYLSDLVLSYSMCATCGLTNILPWTYAIFMTILLIHRAGRDEERCAGKYGKFWKEYCEKVPYKLIPGLY